MTRREVPRVILAHAGVQHSYKTALALHKAGLLAHFYTTLYFNPSSPLYRILQRTCAHQSWLTALQQRRYHPEIPPDKVHSIPWFEAGQRLWSRLSRGRHEDVALTLRNALFDRRIARKLQRLSGGLDVFYGYSGSALHSLRQSKALGKIAVLDHHDIHHETARQLLRDEIELHPDFADTIPYWPPYEPYLRRLGEEDGLADYHIVLSTFAKRTYVEAGIDPRWIFVVPLGVDLRKFTPQNFVEPGNFRVLFVGAIGQGKGAKYLLESLKQLSLPEAELVLAGSILGSGKPLERYNDLFRYERYVEPSDMPDFYRSGSIFVLPSLWDSYGQVIIEAMACGLPVIVSEHTAGRDVVRDGVDGFVIPVRDTDALCEKLLVLYQDRELRQWMGRNAAQRAREFSLECYYQKLVDALWSLWNRSDHGS